MIIDEVGQPVNEIVDISPLREERYENIFRVYEIENNTDDIYYMYNITKKVSIDAINIVPDIVDYYSVQNTFPWTSISYYIYRTQHLWWLLAIINNVIDPTDPLPAGTVIKAIKPAYIENILTDIRSQL